MEYGLKADKVVEGYKNLEANYDRGLFKQLQVTIEQVEKLKAEILKINLVYQM